MLYSRTLSNHNHMVNTLFYYPDWVAKQQTLLWSLALFICNRSCRAMEYLQLLQLAVAKETFRQLPPNGRHDNFTVYIFCLRLITWRLKSALTAIALRQTVLTLKWPGGFLGTQDLFFAHFTTFASAFFTVIFSNCLTIGYASFDAKKF